MDLKECSSCKEFKDVTSFHRRDCYKDGINPRCKTCVSDSQKLYRATEAYRQNVIDNAERKKLYLIGRRYNINADQYYKILTSQNESCFICGATNDLCIDHDHNCCPGSAESCGACVRGVLCRRCNRGVGMFQDSIFNIMNAIRYIQSYE